MGDEHCRDIVPVRVTERYICPSDAYISLYCTCNTYARHICGVDVMAKAIELGLKLKGEDARRFEKFLEHNVLSTRGQFLVKEAAVRSQKRS